MERGTYWLLLAIFSGQIFVEGVRHYSVMSDTPNDDSGDGSEGEQSEGGQPEGGQPQGGQPQGGQPQGGQGGGQPSQGQPQGQAPQGGAQPQGQAPQGQPQGQAQRAPVNTGPSVGDILNRRDTKGEIKIGVAIFALVGAGVGLAIFLNAIIADTTDPGYTIAVFGYLASFALPPLVSAIVAFRQQEQLADIDQTLRLATAGATGAAGGLVMILVTTILSIISLDTGQGGQLLGIPEFGDVILPAILIAIASGVAAAGIVWALNNLLSMGSSNTTRR